MLHAQRKDLMLPKCSAWQQRGYSMPPDQRPAMCFARRFLHPLEPEPSGFRAFVFLPMTQGFDSLKLVQPWA
jgi:hypothetical protein